MGVGDDDRARREPVLHGFHQHRVDRSGVRLGNAPDAMRARKPAIDAASITAAGMPTRRHPNTSTATTSPRKTDG